MEKHKDVFFVIELQPHSTTKQNQIMDPDPHIPCDLMDGRDAFLTMAREKHWEFSTLRRCTYSTMAMLHEIHTSSRDAFVYTCNVCKGQVDTRYHCTVCEVSTTIARLRYVVLNYVWYQGVLETQPACDSAPENQHLKYSVSTPGGPGL